jgi:hypothetical protein
LFSARVNTPPVSRSRSSRRKFSISSFRQPTTKQGLLEEEQHALLPLPKQSFEARRVEPAKANSLSLVRFDTNDYSVPTAYAHHHVTAVGNIQEVRLIVNDRVVARHPRDWARENVHYNPLHYLR